jgi:hypothetical protein
MVFADISPLKKNNRGLAPTSAQWIMYGYTKYFFIPFVSKCNNHPHVSSTYLPT